MYISNVKKLKFFFSDFFLGEREKYFFRKILKKAAVESSFFPLPLPDPF